MTAYLFYYQIIPPFLSSLSQSLDSLLGLPLLSCIYCPNDCLGNVGMASWVLFSQRLAWTRAQASALQLESAFCLLLGDLYPSDVSPDPLEVLLLSFRIMVWIRPSRTFSQDDMAALKGTYLGGTSPFYCGTSKYITPPTHSLRPVRRTVPVFRCSLGV